MLTKTRFGIGRRLTLWGAGVTTILIAVTSATLYAGMYLSLRSQIDAFLEGEIHEFMLTVNAHPNDDARLQSELQQELGVRARNDLGFRLIDLQNNVFISSAIQDDLKGVWKTPPSWAMDFPHVRCETIQPTNNPHAHRVCSLLVHTADGRTCTAQSSYLLDQMTESLAKVRRLCFAILLTTPLIAIAIGSFLARRSLQPVRRIMQTAREINAHDLKERIPLSGTGDEMDQLANTVNGMLNRIEQKVREIQQFTADASHELRTPLAALRGNAELALTQQRTANELRQTIEESVSLYERLQRIAEDLLLLARLDTGETIIWREAVRLDTALADVLDLYGPMGEDKGISLVVDAADNLFVEGDGGRLRQVIGNLLDNAIKYTPHGGQIRVSLVRSNGHMKLEIADTGIGIPEEDLPKVFDRFYRADPSRSTLSTPGSGLGLSISRSIVEAHGGTIEIQSSPQRGTRVRVLIPVGTAQDEAPKV